MFLTETGQVGNILNENQKNIRGTIMNRWGELGLLEGLEGVNKENIAILYENTARDIVNCCGNDTGAYETVAFPMVRRVFANLLANEIVSVQATNSPTATMFFYKPTISDRIVSGEDCGEIRAEHANPFTKFLGDCILSGTNCPTTTFSSCKSLYDRYYDDGLYDHSRGSFTVMCATGSTVCLDSEGCWVSTDATAPNKDCEDCRYKLSSDGSIREVILAVNGFDTPYVTSNTARLSGSRGFIQDTETFLASLKVTNVGDPIVDPSGNVIVDTGCDVPHSLVPQAYGQSIVSYTDACDTGGTMYMKLDLQHPVCDITCSTLDGFVGAASGTTFDPSQLAITYRVYDDLECATDIGSVSFQISKVSMGVDTRTLQACWTPEQAMDLNSYHGIDTEAELTALLSEQIAAEIDREILRDLRNGAAFTGRFDVNGYQKLGGGASYTRKEWMQELITEINRVSAQIHKATLRSGANFLVVSSEISALFSELDNYHTNAQVGSDTFALGIHKGGSIQGRYTVYVDPYAPADKILLGYKGGSSMVDTGYVYAPYMPISLTPTIIDPYNYTSKKAIRTRYAKKMVNNKYYGVIKVFGLKTFSTRELR